MSTVRQCVRAWIVVTCAVLLSARFASPHNQRVTESLVERILQDHLGLYDPKDIKSEIPHYALHQEQSLLETSPPAAHSAVYM